MQFANRHIGPREEDIAHMLATIGESSLSGLIAKVIPDGIHQHESLALATGIDEPQALAELQALSEKNQILTSLIGQGYHDCHTPAVIARNVFENPAWYTAYTPYQPEIAQGRLEVLFNFQTLIAELCAMPIANASLLDEATAAAEAMSMAHRGLRGKRNTIIAASDCHPQTLDVMRTRAEPLGIVVQTVAVADMSELVNSTADDVFAILVQYPGTTGEAVVPTTAVAAAKEAGALVIAAADLLALTLLSPPGEWGADIVVGSAQRFGVPMGFGGPHAAFMATTDAYKRNLPGRLVGQSRTIDGKPAYRLALQTREQHIRREKATSNICTAQALLAIMATLYACYHGPQGLKRIASRVRAHADMMAALLRDSGLVVSNQDWFDTLSVVVTDGAACLQRLEQAGYNARLSGEAQLSLAFDETTSREQVLEIASLIVQVSLDSMAGKASKLEVRQRDDASDRPVSFLSQACFNDFQSETEMMRYLRRLASKDIALDQAMIPLGSCTMKLNAAAEMMPVSWPGFTRIHPFAPQSQTEGYREMIAQLEAMLCACTGYDAVSLQPNAGSQGEYAGLLAIRAYHESRGDHQRTVCLIPSSAHGTNPASAQMVGMQVVVVKCDAAGNVDISDLQAKLDKHADKVAAIMITYPSTHGVFESGVTDVCERVHAAGAQVYIDGANLNAMVGTAQPGKFGGDVSHLNLHKTFCIPHGGGGPGVGPIGVGEHLKPWLPGHATLDNKAGAVSAAPYGSAMILPITWMYIRMMGPAGLLHATEVAILNANYIAARLSTVYPILYRGEDGFVAHECILDTRPLKSETGISVDDIAKRLMDYGFHAPTMSFPVAGTLMVEPTESESLVEIDRFCDAMLQIHAEALKVKEGKWSAEDNPLINAPHTAEQLTADEWTHPYTRAEAVFPAGSEQSANKYWPPVQRIDNVYGDKHLICSCPPLSSYQSEED
ncbi:Glycine dehydrogenase (decarboxylating) [Granulosicoccus antarcticus IMCC3135]|uniref:Glycine dehydrogenase (decarboxylating) n=2 Tax=Granulosicoccus TaxID=437504 RepID=A0A2Z2NYC4_9GAMM|nr:Glycine dehydrogenase (decarboxylating) [Granulosicoccus antarcticus IMCC3135]